MKRILLAFAVVTVLASGALMAFVAGASSSTRFTFGDGMHRVGRDVPAGTYRAPNARSGCYWARLKSFSGNLDAIIANGNANGPAIVTIGRRDAGFESTRCGRWTSNLRRITKSKTRFGPGTFIVGTDIAPGTYRGRGGSCYWARLRSFGGTLNSVIANGNGTGGSVIVTINRGDKGFESSRCGTWTRF